MELTDEMRALLETCSTCRFWRKSGRQYAKMECRARSPIMVEHKSSCASWLGPGWPDASADQWCGEYQRAGRAALGEGE
jgi:hypothetical protein